MYKQNLGGEKMKLNKESIKHYFHEVLGCLSEVEIIQNESLITKARDIEWAILMSGKGDGIV